MKWFAAVVITLSLAIPSCAQSLPDKPQARVVDTELKVQAAVMAAAWTLDTVSMHSRIRWCDQYYGTRNDFQLHCIEGGAFFPGTRATAKIMGSWAAIDIAAVIVAYEWKKHVHNKWLHPLWRLPLLQRTMAHGSAAIGNFRYTRP